MKEGDVIFIKGEKRKRQMEVGVVERRIQGRDGVIRGTRLRAGKTHPERLLQLLYPLELTCDRSERRGGETLRADAREFQPGRTAADARQRIAAIAQDGLNED